jgi:hypothetical protein
VEGLYRIWGAKSEEWRQSERKNVGKGFHRFNKFSSKTNSSTKNIVDHNKSVTVSDLKPERSGSPLAEEEKCHGK